MNWQERAENAEESLRSLASYVGAGGYNADTVDAEVFEQKIRWGIRQFMDRLEKAEAELARLAKQEPVAFWWIGEGGENHGGPYRGMASEFSIDNARNSGCSPQYLYAAPPAVAAGLPAIGPYRDFIPAPAAITSTSVQPDDDTRRNDEAFAYYCANRAVLNGASGELKKPAVAAPSVPEEWREVMTELADDLAIEIDQSYPPERRAYPSEQRRYEREMAIVNRARALLQSSQAAPAELAAPSPDDIHQLAYELGGTDSGEYHLEPEALDKIIAAVLEMAAAPVPANQPLCGVLAVPANLVDTLAGIALKCTDCYTTDAIDALLQSSQAALAVPNLVESHQIKAPDCRTCANRGRVNGLSQESYCDSCVYQGRDWRQNHFVDVSKMVDAVKRRCEACAILPCSCK